MIEAWESAVIVGTITFLIPLSVLRGMPEESLVNIIGVVGYSVGRIFPRETSVSSTETLGQLLSQFS